MKVLFIEADAPRELSTSVFLARIPAAAINRTGGRHFARVIHRNEFLANPPDLWPDLLVFERLLLRPFTDKIREYQSAGVRTLARFDDAFQLIPQYLSSAALWKRSLVGIKQDNGSVALAKMDVSALDQFREGLGVCDAASTPSRLLCKDFERYAKKMFFLPNYLDLGNPAWTVPKPKHEGIIIGWGGGGTHKQSVRDSSILPALRRICRNYPQVKIMICGYEQWVKDKLASLIPARQLITHDWVPNEEWVSVMSNFDIGLAPLAGSYDDRRSWIKCLDYAARGIPFVCSKRPPYRTVRGGIRVTNGRKEWHHAIKTLLDKQSTYDRLAKMGHDWAWKQGISQHISTYLNVMTDVLKG